MSRISIKFLQYFFAIALTIGIFAGAKTTAFASLHINGGAAIDASDEGDGWRYDDNSKTLTLDGFSVPAGNEPAISIDGLNKFNIVLVGNNNTINVNNAYGIDVNLTGSNAEFTISGTGSLNVTATGADTSSSSTKAINCDGIIKIEKCRINATAIGDNAIGISSGDDLMISNKATVVSVGETNSGGEGYGLKADFDITIDNSSVTASARGDNQNAHGIYSRVALIKNSSIVNASGQVFGILGTDGIKIESNSTVEASASDGDFSVGISTVGDAYLEIANDVKSVVAEGGDLAITGKIKNAVKGTGWLIYGGLKPIDINNDEVTFPSRHDKVQFPRLAPTISSVPVANNLVANGNDQTLLTAGTSTNGTMQYAIGTSPTTAPGADAFSADIPTAKNAGVYYVWYRAIGAEDSEYGVSDPECITVEIKKPELSITVTTDGNGTATASAVKGVEGTEITLTATPNNGYKLSKWEVISGGVTVENNKFVMKASNVEIKAIFEIIKCTVSFDANGGSGSMAAVTADINSDYTLPACTFTAPAGMLFEKWDQGAVGTVIKVTDNITLKAIWKAAPESGNDSKTDDTTEEVVTGTTISGLEGGKKSIIVKWSVRSDVNGYEIQCATNKNFKKDVKKFTVNKATTTKTTIKKLEDNTKYFVKIRTFKNVSGTKKYSDWSKVKSVKTEMATSVDKEQHGSKITKLKAGKGSIKVTWVKVKDVKGYEIQYSLDKKFKKNAKTVTVSKASTKTKTISKLTSKKNYYVRIRTYKISDKKKLCSKWSEVKSIKTK